MGALPAEATTELNKPYYWYGNCVFFQLSRKHLACGRQENLVIGFDTDGFLSGYDPTKIN
jgi:hypothetical protein